MKMSDDNLLTPAQAAEILNVSTTTLRQWAQSGKIKFAATLGGHRRFEEDYIRSLAKTSKAVIRNKHVLVVDDDEMFASMLIDFFEIHYPDVDVSVALSGFDAGEALYKIRPDLIILDLMMPGLDGFAVCSHIKTSDSSKNTPVIAISGDANQENIEKIIEAGAECCLAKPLDVEQLKAAVQKLL